MGGSSSKNDGLQKKSVNPYSKSQQSYMLTPPVNSSSEDEFYDGIPRFLRSFSQSTRVAKVAQVSSRLGRAGSTGLVRTVEALDTIGSSLTNLNLSSGFVSGAAIKGNELSILSFEVANTIVKGSSLMHSLSRTSMRQLRNVVLPSEGVQLLVSNDMDELLAIVADDKRKELQIFAREVVRFESQCKDPQWHNLDRFFEKYRREPTPQTQLREGAEFMMQLLVSNDMDELLAIVADDKRKELQIFSREVVRFGSQCKDPQWHNLDRFFEKYRREPTPQTQLREGAEFMMQQLMALVQYTAELYHELHTLDKFEQDYQHKRLENGKSNASQKDPNSEEKHSLVSKLRLGPAGLDLHYANIVLQIDSILTVTEIKAEMEKTLHWLVPVATITAKAHHGFGWVGEWANPGSESNRRSVVSVDVSQIETLHHADKQKSEAYILELILWINYLVAQSNATLDGGLMRSLVKPPECSSPDS